MGTDPYLLLKLERIEKAIRETRTMPIYEGLIISICPAAQLRLARISDETGRAMENLAAAAVEEECLRYFRDRGDDPGKPP
jgi:hypothetical protein